MFTNEKFNPITREHVLQEYRRGLTAEGCIGLHGTSLEAMKHVLANGSFAGETRRSAWAEEKGDIFFTPLKQRGVLSLVDIEMSTLYANKNAAKHFLSRELDLDFRRPKDNETITLLLNKSSIFTHSKYSVLFEKRGWNPGEIKKTVELAKQQKGIIVGIKEEIANRYRISEDSRLGGRNDGPRIITGESGLPFSAIVGVRALGGRERDYFQQL